MAIRYNTPHYSTRLRSWSAQIAGIGGITIHEYLAGDAVRAEVESWKFPGYAAEVPWPFAGNTLRLADVATAVNSAAGEDYLRVQQYGASDRLDRVRYFVEDWNKRGLKPPARKTVAKPAATPAAASSVAHAATPSSTLTAAAVAATGVDVTITDRTVIPGVPGVTTTSGPSQLSGIVLSHANVGGAHEVRIDTSSFTPGSYARLTGATGSAAIAAVRDASSGLNVAVIVTLAAPYSAEAAASFPVGSDVQIVPDQTTTTTPATPAKIKWTVTYTTAIDFAALKQTATRLQVWTKTLPIVDLEIVSATSAKVTTLDDETTVTLPIPGKLLPPAAAVVTSADAWATQQADTWRASNPSNFYDWASSLTTSDPAADPAGQSPSAPPSAASGSALLPLAVGVVAAVAGFSAPIVALASLAAALFNRRQS